MNLRQAAQQALEALEAETSESWECNSYHPKIQPAITALRQALAEPEQEMTKQKPVAWTDERGFIARHADSFPRGTTVSPLYAHPPTPQPDTDCHLQGICQRSGYSIAPTPRKPLTDEEIVQVLGSVRESITGNVFLAFARAIERAHGITGDSNE